MCDLDPRFNIRRKMAWISVYSVLTILVALGFFIAFGGEEQRQNIEAANGILITIIGSFTTLIAGYGVSVSIDDLKKMGLNKTNRG